MRAGAFFKSSKEIVRDFLNNVIAIDDNLFFDESNDNLEIEDDFYIPEDQENWLGQPAENDIRGDNIQAAPIAHPLNYQNLSLAFSEYGINCCAFKPDKEKFDTIDAAAEHIQKSTKRADITILDWSMDEKFGSPSGTLAKSSIEKILLADKEMHGRLRLIVIYTGEPNPVDIAESIYKKVRTLDGSAILTDQKINFTSSDFEFCQINVIEKDYEADALRDEVIALFTELTIGLLSNATLSAIGELRDKTHHILHAFNKRLDPAYLSHVIGLLSSPEVREKSHEIAFDYATDLISEEFKSNLQISQKIKKILDKDVLHEWILYISKDKEKDFFRIKIGSANEIGIDSVRMKELLTYTSEENLINTLKTEPKIINKKKDEEITESFSRNKIQLNLKGATDFPHEMLSAIECKRRDLLSLRNDSPLPTIKQGSILQKDKNYYVCMQPLCDSVRINAHTNFIFLKIEHIDDGKKFTHVLTDKKGQFIKFFIKPGSKDIHIFKLIPDKQTNTVKVVNEAGKYLVQHLQEDEKTSSLIWLGELKANIAQSIANKLAEQISRVGLDTNEWLRRH